ncbi:Wee1 kinase isoform B [Micractinium conductrix]|uniref:Wee1 kinase isoform B n=1 Tax=Micractinium conductrix TaxID=554055 RepID=A0A2P6VH02_9CHLO|nr:Wee1 kinase isoform B [Micractinium conductrix]|eukprot:PSC73365.1 Wee1 kinase isoform B [Micractinium conductrix]
MKLSFSQELGAGLKAMSLSTQSQSTGGMATQERPPVPLFADGPPVASAQLQPVPLPLDIPSLSQQDFLGTQDFVTPVDQFQLDYDPKDAKRSPARLSPDRVKRPRQGSSAGMDEGCEPVTEARGGFAGPSGRGGGYAGGYGGGGRRPLRVQSPPCYRNIFAEEDAEEAYAPWKARRPAPQAMSRYRHDFKEVGLLGQGNFSKVFRARHRFDGREYAVKRSQREARPDCPAFAQYIQEAQVLAHLPPHPNVVQYFGCWSEPHGDGEHLYLQLEKCDVSLGVHASLGEQLREPDLLEILQQTAAGLAHLHRHGVAHLDVKPDNIYLQEPLEGADAGSGTGSTHGGATMPPGVRYKLGDFGQATPLDLNTPLGFDEGDCRYLPLEVMNGQLGQLHKADMFALGATLLELATRVELPSGGQQYQDLRAGRLPLLPTCTRRFAGMVKALMAPRPEDRPTAEQVLQSPLFCKAGGSPGGSGGCAPLAHQSSTVSTQSTATAEHGGGAAGATGNSKQFGGLVLQRSTAAK